VDALTRLDDTALHFASREGHLAATKLLVARGANVNRKTKFGLTPLDHAQRDRGGDWVEVAAFLEACTHNESDGNPRSLSQCAVQ